MHPVEIACRYAQTSETQHFKKTIGNKIKRNLLTEKNREFWKSVDEAAKEVNGWPSWKRGNVSFKIPKEI